MKTYSIEELKDEFLGPIGSETRDKYEFNVKLEIEGELIENSVSNPKNWERLLMWYHKIELTKLPGYSNISFCSNSIWFSRIWYDSKSKKFIKAHAKKFLKSKLFKGWRIEKNFLFWKSITYNYYGIEEFKDIREQFCVYMMLHCQENPYTKWDKFVNLLKFKK